MDIPSSNIEQRKNYSLCQGPTSWDYKPHWEMRSQSNIKNKKLLYSLPIVFPFIKCIFPMPQYLKHFYCHLRIPTHNEIEVQKFYHSLSIIFPFTKCIFPMPQYLIHCYCHLRISTHNEKFKSSSTSSIAIKKLIFSPKLCKLTWMTTY